MLKSGRYTWRRGGMITGLATALWLFVSVSADAGLVSGRVSDAAGKFRPGSTFHVKGADGKVVQVTTDKVGNYRVFLPPGIYTVEFPDGRKAEILSHQEPIKQDINLQ